jgi:hypothetical protein
MKTETEKQNDSIWWNFIEALSDEFINQTGFGIYAYITPLDVHHVYQEFQKHDLRSNGDLLFLGA